MSTEVKPKIDVWSIPSRGTEWCDCGDSHEVTKEMVSEYASYFTDGEWMTHDEVVMTCMLLWNYEEVCEFFLMRVRDSAIEVTGEVRNKYPISEAVDIIGHFSKTWQGCPEEACEGVFGLPEL